MEESHKICNRCSVLISEFSPALLTVMKLQKTPLEQHLSTILENESCKPDVAKEWLFHIYYGKCEEHISHCLYCGGKLKTWRAKQCLHCHKSWHENL